MDIFALKEKFKVKFGKFTEILSSILLPRPHMAGIEFKDAAIRMALLKNGLPPARAGVAHAGDLKKAAVMLEPGIIDNGKIKDRLKLMTAVRNLREQFGLDKNEMLPVVAVIPSINVYTKVFSTPLLNPESLKEAALLNLKSISPIGVDGGYADWQQVGKEDKDGKIDVLGAFVTKESVDEYVKILEESGFNVVATEFPALAITRAIKELAADVDLNKPQVVINLASDGIDFMILSYGDLYFDYFVPWKLVQEDGRISREILFEDFKDTIVREVRKMANFYGSHWGGKIENLILISQALNAEISDLIKINFQYQVNDLHLSNFTDLKASWLAVLGSALRGRIPRHKDIFISLMAIGTEELSLRSETMFFFKTWRNILIATLSFITLGFLLADSFVAHTENNLNTQLSQLANVSGGTEISQLKQRATVFNQLVEKISVAKSRSIAYSSVFSKVYEAMNSGIILTRVSLDANQSTVQVLGEARDNAAAIDYKNNLVKAGFEDVSLPLSSLQEKAAGGVTFTISFKL